MSDLRFNTIAGTVLGSAMLAVGLGIVSEQVFHPHFPETAGYAIDTSAVLAPAGGAPAEEAGPVDWGVILADPALIAVGERSANKCVACHTFDKGGANLSGPNQWDLVNRVAGTHPGFTYSAAMREYGQPWTYDNLDEFLRAPAQDIRGTAMQFVGVRNAEERHALIAYLRSRADSPAPLPAPLPPQPETPAEAPAEASAAP